MVHTSRKTGAGASNAPTIRTRNDSWLSPHLVPRAEGLQISAEGISGHAKGGSEGQTRTSGHICAYI